MICFSMFDIVNLFLKKTMGRGEGGWRRGGGVGRDTGSLFLFSWFEVLWLLAGV